MKNLTDFRILNFPLMDSNILTKPAYGVMSQLVSYGRICTSKVDFVDRIRRLSSRLNPQGFKGQMNQNFDIFFYFSSILVKCV